jgi:integrase
MRTIEKVRGVFEKVPGSKVWWIRYNDCDGVLHREKVGLRSAAINHYRKRKTEAMQGKKMPESFRSKAVTFGELAADALQWGKAHKKSWKDDDYRIKKLLPHFGQQGAESITAKDIEGWLIDNTSTPASANRYRALISLCYRQGIRNERVTLNPARAVSQRAENNGVIRFLRPDEEMRILNVMHADYPQQIPAFVVALNTGMRAGELFPLVWQNVDMDRRQITIPMTKNGTVGHVNMNDETTEALKTARENSLGSCFVFENFRGQKQCTQHRWFADMLLKAKVTGFRWHDLRHTFCSRLVMAGVDMKTVQTLARHKTLAMTARYVHLAPGAETAALRKLTAFQSLQQNQPDTRTDTEHNLGKQAA